MRLAGWVAVAFLAGCGGGDFSGPAGAMPVGCTPGEQRECSCPGGTKSVQVCEKDGTLGVCACDAADGGGDAAQETGPVLCGGQVCGVVPNGVGQCVAEHCAITCSGGMKNCDLIAENGCECAGDCSGTVCVPR